MADPNRAGIGADRAGWRPAGLVRLVHPLPTALTSATTVGIALVAGADTGRALVAGAAMLALQASIGSYNDLVDAASDARVQPAKPIPSGAASRPIAIWMAVGGLVTGLTLAAGLGRLAFAIASVGVACGYVHSRWTKGTALAPLPFAIGFALLPPFAWVATASVPPPAAAVVVALGMVSGAAIALANAAAGAERDAAAGIPTPAVRLGRRTTNVVISALLAIVAAIAIITIVGFRPGQLATLTATLGLVLLGVGVLMVWRPPRRVEIAWELCAAGLAVLGIAWLAAAGQR